jgi:hypothetical protein
MKKIAHLTLLTLWLFAVIAPSAVALMDIDNPIVITNLNEEEQQETVKKNQAEEKIVTGNKSLLSLILQSNKSIVGHHFLIDHIDYTSEILLPPPEQFL